MSESKQSSGVPSVSGAIPGAPSLADVYAAKIRIAPYLWRTPLFTSGSLSRMTGTTLRLKAENLQRTGSFKTRGAINAVLQLSPEDRARGVVSFSAGNFGQALAYAARFGGVRCTIFMAENAVPVKIEAIRGYGAETKFGPSIQEAFAAMEGFSADTGAVFISPFAGAHVIAGQGTVGLKSWRSFRRSNRSSLRLAAAG